MEEQTAKSDERDGQQKDIPLVQSMQVKVKSPKKRVGKVRSKKSTFKSYVHPDTICQSVSEECIANEDRNNFHSEVRSDGDEEQPTRTFKTEDGNEGVEEFREPPDDFDKCERKSSPSVSSSMKTQGAESSQGQKEGELLEDTNNNEPSVEEHMAGATSLLNSPSQQSFTYRSHPLMSSERCDIAQMEFKNEQLEEACGGPSKPVGMDPNIVLNHETDVNVTSRTARSASDPVAQKRKEEKPLSSSISNLQEYENVSNAMRRHSKAALILGWEESDMGFRGTEQENSLSKVQKKGVKKKMKNLTHKLMEKFKEKHDFDHAESKSIQDGGEEEAQCIDSMELKVESSEVPPRLPSKKGKHVILERTFTLKDFKLNLEPINLMEEIFTGEEWLSYLPSKTSPADKDTNDQPVTYDVLQTKKDTLLNIPLLMPQQDQTEDTKKNQEDASVAQEENATKVNGELHMEQVKEEAKTFAIPKALLTNEMKKRISDCESKKSEDIYDCLDMYIIPKSDSKSLDDMLVDFSAVKSFELLDNSALKSRIRLSKKRAHKPPKKVKTEKSNSKFYTIPEVILNESPVSPSPPFNSIPFSKSPPHSSLFPDHT